MRDIQHVFADPDRLTCRAEPGRGPQIGVALCLASGNTASNRHPGAIKRGSCKNGIG